MAKPEVLTVLKHGITFDAPTYTERHEPFAVIRCPGCKQAGSVDLDQYQGKVSIQCDNCDYHETHNLTGTINV